ncbi:MULTISPECIES: alpha-amylase family glycosyl hydrolase [unclassified Cryobacterium]|uniref:alpha-amylase family glycosyl hydrolase n=1 Tax=unclassified Cryobacterium TaxID=2649013 RepID=UPI002AB43DB8|nr:MULTISPECIES: alpha-amylase family glycosyl hydrolase [unclassified Cryobacterium]MDY7541918.1 alpha-amylase family glycosyl hydrolase [Cryobacterium sp. 5B3]MEA9998593.1 alpha-amylase family glycosyl hydrolase [Cryobacterium sp. RTS3]MEB0266858.1 alpha-amylase family glycosyl hydrolase [Cryobacterium sp. 10I5]MEB0276072.1 alpha-amylase family glycosyl hydrolase [Cryobacterium sp. 5B3]
MTDVELLVYADRIGGTIPALAALLDGPLRAFGSVHVLPFYVPFDGADAGFDPVDHAAVDPRLGTWPEVRALAGSRGLTADLVVNHVSASSVEFTDWLARGPESPWDGMFLTYGTVFPHGASEAELTAFYRPRPGLPFTGYRGADGSRHLVWTTFLPSQVDLDVANPVALAYLRRVLRVLADGGVTTVRLDAVGYAVKTPGTDSFMTPETLAFVEVVTDLARAEDLAVLVEVHGYYAQQLAIAPLVDWVYDFALAPLLLHSLGTGTVDRLANWFEIRPANAVTVLDTHDGIGVIDAGPAGGRPGLLSEAEMAEVFARAAEATHGHSSVASVVPEWATLPHQINATFFSTLGGDVVAYLVARAVQHFLPGRPQTYYVGLLGGLDDRELFAETGSGRDVNRHRYPAAEVEEALASEVTRAQLGLVRLRSTHPAFDGLFTWSIYGRDVLELRWVNAARDARAVLTVCTALGATSFRIQLADADGSEVLDTVESLAAWTADTH